MKKYLMITIALAMMFVFAGSVSARPAKEKYEGKTAGNSGFTNFVGDNVEEGNVTGWVRYGKTGKSLNTTWVVNGLEPNTNYQLKLQSMVAGDVRLLDDCDDTGVIWECGTLGGVTFLVLATVQSDGNGHIGHGVKEDRLLSGEYVDMQFMVTQNESPWLSAWTWENSDDSNGIGDGGAPDWGSDISVFEITE